MLKLHYFCVEVTNANGTRPKNRKIVVHFSISNIVFRLLKLFYVENELISSNI